jgi:acetyl-CoA C-acetyltransferase
MVVWVTGGLVQPVIVSACRTPIGKFGKSLRDVPATRLGGLVIREAISRAGISPPDVQEVIMGNVLSAGLGQNPARQAAVYAGVPYHVPAVTVNKVCGSGLKAVMLAAQAIKAGDLSVVVAGGMESMSGAPYLLRHTRWGLKYGDDRVLDHMIHDGLWDAYNNYHMGMTGEIIAEKYGITRREADEFAYRSHMRAAEARRTGGFSQEIVPVTPETVGVEAELLGDECIREDTSMEKLARLPPVFKPGGILTAGNSSQLSDGASALVLMSDVEARERGIRPLARIVAYEAGGVPPEMVMEAPVPTVRRLLARAGLSVDDVDVFEHNEAYATASLAVSRALSIDLEKMNVKGGAIALGHPIGCSGARILTTLLYIMKERALRRGLATLCVGGGNAVAVLVERT